MIDEYIKLLDTYIIPIIKATDSYVTEDGQIASIENKNLIYQFENKRYKPDESNGPKTIIPTIPKNNVDYLRIKNTKGLEIFNPFKNIKHMTLLTILMKNSLSDFFFVQENESEGEEIIDAILDESEFEDDSTSFYSEVLEDGRYSYVFSDNTDPTHPKEIVRVTNDDQFYSMWAICVEAMRKMTNKLPKQFDNLEKAWKHITNVMEDWERYKKTIASDVKQDHDVDTSYVDIEDSDITDPSLDDFVEEDEMDDYLTKLCAVNKSLGEPEILTETCGQHDVAVNGEDLIDFSDMSADEVLQKILEADDEPNLVM